MGTKSKDWAWAKLGIAKTSNKDAIHAAYAAKRAELDAEAMRISAFAELTEAREKALFLASELQREAERSGETNAKTEAESIEEPVTEEVPPVEQPELQQEAPAEPEPEPEPEPEAELEPEPEYSRAGPWSRGEGKWPLADNSAHGEPLLPPENVQELDGGWEHGGGYKPAYDLPEDEQSEYQPEVEPGLDPDPDDDWSHSGSYIPDAEKTIDPDLLIPEPSPLEEASEVDRKVRGAVRSFFERYPIKTYWVVYAIMALFLVRSCS